MSLFAALARRPFAALVLLAVVACGGDAPADDPIDVSDVDNPLEAAAVASRMGERVQDATAEIERFRAERVAKGDTVAMGYVALQEFLPSAPGGYRAEGDPSGRQQSMAGFSMSEAEQRFVGDADASGNAPSITVTLMDFGGSEIAYSMFAMPLMLNMQMEDDERRMRTAPLDVEHTFASEEYDKQSHDVKITAVTRYRYVVTVEAEGQSGDRTEEIRALAARVAKGFAGK